MYIGIRGSNWPLESICSGPMESPSSNVIPPHSPLSEAVAIGIAAQQSIETGNPVELSSLA